MTLQEIQNSQNPSRITFRPGSMDGGHIGTPPVTPNAKGAASPIVKALKDPKMKANLVNTTR